MVLLWFDIARPWQAIMTKPPPPIHLGKLTLDQKAQIVAYAAKQGKPNNVETAKWATQTFNLRKPLHPSTVYRILERKDEYRNIHPHEKSLKNRRRVMHSEIENALKNYIIDKEAKKIRLTVSMIKDKARAFAESLQCGLNLKFSNGWYEYSMILTNC